MAASGTGLRIMSALIWAVTVGFFAVAFALQDVLRAEETTAAAISGTVILGLCHALGGAIAGYALAGLFGRAGAGGWLVALLGATLATLLGGLLGGGAAALYGVVTGTANFTTEMIRIGLGAVTTPLAIAEGPWLTVVWLAAWGVAHWTARGVRAG